MNIITKKILSFLFLLFILGTPLFVGAAFNTDISGEIGESGLSDSTILEIALAVMNWMLIIITVLAVIGFIISGIYFIIGTGTKQIETAKSWLIYSIIGIVVALLGYIILGVVDSLLHGDPTQGV